MIKDPKLVPIAKNYQNFLAHRETHLKMVSTGVESITIWGEALSFVGSCACTNQSRHFVRRSTENIRAFKSLTAGFIEKSIGSKKRLVVSWTDLQIVQLLCRQMKYKSHRISPEP